MDSQPVDTPEEAAAHKTTRRQAIRALGGGIGTAALTAAGQERAQAAPVDKAAKASVAYQVDPERLREITDVICSTMTSPEFLEQTRWVFEAPEEERVAEAAKRLSVDALRGLGLDLSEDFRVSSRYFEADWPASIELGDYPEGENPILADPERLSALRLEDPDQFWQIVTLGRRPETLQLGSIAPFEDPRGPIRWGGCAGAGAATICGCAGYNT